MAFALGTDESFGATRWRFQHNVAMAVGADHREPGTHHPGVRWLIDGMNLVGSRPDGWWKDRDRAVRRLIEELSRYAAASGEGVTVVFDRQPQDVPPGVHGAATVAFASRRERNAADDEIVRMLAQDPAPHSFTVVTSDRRLVERVRELGAEVASSASFRRRMDKALAGAPTQGT